MNAITEKQLASNTYINVFYLFSQYYLFIEMVCFYVYNAHLNAKQAGSKLSFTVES